MKDVSGDIRKPYNFLYSNQMRKKIISNIKSHT